MASSCPPNPWERLLAVVVPASTSHTLGPSCAVEDRFPDLRRLRRSTEMPEAQTLAPNSDARSVFPQHDPRLEGFPRPSVRDFPEMPEAQTLAPNSDARSVFPQHDPRLGISRRRLRRSTEMPEAQTLAPNSDARSVFPQHDPRLGISGFPRFSVFPQHDPRLGISRNTTLG
jgi:hypothetical protein